MCQVFLPNPVHVHIPKALRHKWDKKSVECILVGYCEDSKAYRLYELTHQKIHVRVHTWTWVHACVRGQPIPSMRSRAVNRPKLASLRRSCAACAIGTIAKRRVIFSVPYSFSVHILQLIHVDVMISKLCFSELCSTSHQFSVFLILLFIPSMFIFSRKIEFIVNLCSKFRRLFYSNAL